MMLEIPSVSFETQRIMNGQDQLCFKGSNFTNNIVPKYTVLTHYMSYKFFSEIRLSQEKLEIPPVSFQTQLIMND